MGTSGVIFADKSFSELARTFHDLIGSATACSEIVATQRQWACRVDPQDGWPRLR